MPQPVSICMLAMNEADKIGRALQSARQCPWCDEILVFDSGSTDSTLEIARSLAHRVEHHDWVDFSTNRRLLVEAARNDRVFILDADEEISPALRDEISRLTDAQWATHPVYSMPRRNHLFGRHVRAWDPDRVDRLLDRRRVNWPTRSVHDHPSPLDGSVGKLSGAIEHNRDWDDWLDYFDGARYQSRADSLASEMLEAGKRTGFLDMALRPSLAFWKFYLLRGGFLDGAFGLMVAQKAAFSVQLKYARLWHMQRQPGGATGKGGQR